MPQKRKIKEETAVSSDDDDDDDEEEQESSPRQRRTTPRRRAAARPVKYTVDDDSSSSSSDIDDNNDSDDNEASTTSSKKDVASASKKDEDDQSTRNIEEELKTNADEVEDEDMDKEEKQVEKENADEEEEQEEEKQEKQQRTGSRSDNDDDDYKEEEASRLKKKPKVTSDFNEECEHCGKSFKHEHGLSYHLENMVCRKDAPARRKTSTGKRKKSEASGQSFPRIRGKEGDRTCPHCGKKFTSVLGCQYHVRKGVCLKKQAAEAIPFDTLKPGLKFITPLGVVEVIRDDRAVPVPAKEDNDKNEAETTEQQAGAAKDEEEDGAGSVDDNKGARQGNSKRKRKPPPPPDPAKMYRLAVSRRNAQAGRVKSAVTIMSMVRRKEFTRAYEAGKIDKESIWEMQYGKDPREIPPAQHNRLPPLVPVDTEDPSAPSSSCPDRIVVCRWVQDQRRRVLGVDEELPLLDEPPSLPDNRPNLFLRRRMLNEPFVEGLVSHMCPTCGQEFLSRPGAVYHIQQAKCAEVKESESTKLVKNWDSKAATILARKDVRRAEGKPALSSVFSSATSNPRFPTNSKFPPNTRAAKPIKAKSDKGEDTEGPKVKGHAKTQKEKKMELSARADFVDPRKVLADLESEWRLQQSIMIGPIYPAVFKALRFEKPVPEKKRKRRSKQEIERDMEREAIAKAKKQDRESREMLAKTRSRIAFPEKGSSPTECISRSETKEETPVQVPRHSLNGVAIRQDVTPGNPPEPAVQQQGAPVQDPGSPDKAPAEEQWMELTMLPEGQAPDAPGQATLAPQRPDLVPVDQETKQSQLEEDAPKANPANQENDEPPIETLIEQEPLFEYGKFLNSLSERPPMIDTRVLVQEIDGGRYPSINRRAARNPDTGKYAGRCPICRTDDPVLLKCNFCPRSVHITCARLKFTLPDPEPYDDFICTVCIQSITHRRNRAERRRIEKAIGVEAAATTPMVTEMKHPQIPLHRDVPQKKEYEAVVSQGRHMANLVDLEADARARLQREIENAKLSGIRQQMMTL